MRTVATIELAISEMLHESLPAHLKKRGVKDAKRWVREHLERYTEEKVRFPNEQLLPWTNWIAYGSWDRDTFFVVLILQKEVIELFCGIGHWPENGLVDFRA